MDAEKIKFRVGQKPFTIQWLNLIWLFFIPLRVHRVSAVQWAALGLHCYGAAKSERKRSKLQAKPESCGCSLPLFQSDLNCAVESVDWIIIVTGT